MERDFTKALNILSGLSQKYKEPDTDGGEEGEEFRKAWIDAVIKADKERKRREKEEGLFRIGWGGHCTPDTLYRLEDYEAIADYIEKHGAFPLDLALEEKGA